MRLPRWHWAYTLFRLADGVTHALIPLVPLLRFDAPAWSVPAMVAAMNLASVPASFLWAALMERHRGIGRRRLAVSGFGVACVALVAMAFAPSILWFGIAAAAFAAFGVATGPAASVLALESVPGPRWAEATARMARATGVAYLLGVVAVTGIGLAGWIDLRLTLLFAAMLSVAAAVWAARTIAPATRPVQREAIVRPWVRRFERPVWFPTRMRFAPTLKGLRMADGDPLKLLVAILLLFLGSTTLFAAYPGILSRDLGFTLGWVLLAQAPSQFTTPFAARWSAAFGDRRGELPAVGVAVLVRAVALLGLVAGIVWGSLGLLLAAHALMGLGFSILQVNGACLFARVHRGGRGQGIGSYHAAVGVGSLLGSLLAVALLALASTAAVLLAAVIIAGLGSLLQWSLRRSDHFVARNEGVMPEAAE